MSSQVEIAAAKRALMTESHSKGVQYISGTDTFVTLAIKQVETIECTAGATAAVEQVETIGVTAGATAAVLQVETITCTAGESTGAGNITMTITANGMASSPKAVVVAVAGADDVSAVGLALRTALAADTDVFAFFTVSGTGANAVLTARAFAANDATMAFGFVDTGTTGVTFGASTNTTAGVADASGNITMTITAAGMTGSAHDVVIPVVQSDSADVVAGKIRVALAADAVITAFLAISGATSNVIMTALAPAANDATMAFGFVDTDTTGVTCGASTNTTAGVADASGDVTMTITSANMIGSPRAIVVALVESDTPTIVTTKLKAALAADTFVPTMFTIGGTATTTTLTPIVAIANDATLAFGYVDTDTTGSTFGASTNTTTAVMPDASVVEGEVYCEIYCRTATTFATLTAASDFDIVGTITGVEFPIGCIIYGRFTTIDLTSGTILAYKV